VYRPANHEVKRMSRSIRYVFLFLLIPALLLVLPLAAQKGARDGQWLSYSADHGSTGYSPVDLVNRDNVKNLQVAWSWKFDNFGATSTEVTPIMVNGILYFPLSPRRTIVAADGGTGETLWTWRPPQDDRETRAARTYARGVGYWKDGDEERIITITPGMRLVALDLKRDIAPKVVDLARDAGLLLNAPRPNLLRFMPALNVSNEEIDAMLAGLEAMLEKVPGE